jgi:RNA polymerase sigma-54 factor
MAMELNITQRQSQMMIMTPQLQQAIKLLQLSQMELSAEIQEWIKENPYLEMTPPADSAEAAGEITADPRRDQTPDSNIAQSDQFADATKEKEENIRDEFDWNNFLDELSSAPYHTLSSGTHEAPEETPSYESYVASLTSLTDFLEGQWRFVATSDADYRRGGLIIGNIDDDGYLQASPEEMARMGGCDPADMEDTLRRIQELDPPGVAARNLSECLLLQLKRKDQGESLAAAICREHLRLLEKKDLGVLCKALKCEREAAAEAIGLIRSLDPRPGRAYAQNDAIYVTPDVSIQKIGDKYVITLNEDGLPKLKISRYYRNMLKYTKDEETRKYLNEKSKGAIFLIKSIHQRQKTIYRVTESIFKFQRDFLEKGVEHLKPLVLRDVAEDLGFHESTISRVTTNKYVNTPRGVFELKYFFDSPINRFQGDSLSSESVKNRIKNIIGGEDPKKPLSDQKIVEILQGSNINIARRTVAKYREILGLGSSAERKEMF